MQNHTRTHALSEWQHSHDFSVIHEHGERRTTQVLLLTAGTMGVEIAAGVIYGSMALLADGWHMGTHVAAFMITLFAYRYAKKNAANPAFAFGTGKVGVLGGFTSAIALAVVALIMLSESLHRLFAPQQIQFNEAIAVAVLGLSVNLICAFILRDHHHSHHHEHHRHAHGYHHHDHNLRAAYLHVLADALTSVLAIIALIAGKYLGWNWLDPVMGMVGAAIITHWSYGLLRETSPILLDRSIEQRHMSAIAKTLESDSDNQIADLHIWKVGPRHYATIVSIVTHYPKQPGYYKDLLVEYDWLEHITIEVNHCAAASCLEAQQRDG